MRDSLRRLFRIKTIGVLAVCCAICFLTVPATARQSGEIATPTSIYTVEASYSAGGTQWLSVRVIVEWTHVEGATTYSAEGWGPQQGQRRWTLEPAVTSYPSQQSFPKSIIAQQGNLLYRLASEVARADDDDGIDEMYARLESDFRLAGYPWQVYGETAEDFRTWVSFERDTVSVGETFDAYLIFDNYVRNPESLDNIEPVGTLSSTSTDGGDITVASGPTPGAVTILEYSERDTIRYSLTAESAGTVLVEGMLEGGFQRFYPDRIQSDSVCGDFESIPCTVVIEESGLIVNDTGDGADTDPGDGICDGDDDAYGPQCTLRAALEEAEAGGGEAEIEFDLEGEAPYVIAPESPLPVIGDAITLDATTQPGWVDAPLVRIDGANAGGSTAGLVVDGSDVTIRGLMITGFGSHGIHVSGGSGGLLETLVVGSDASGAGGMGNGGDGIHISGGTDLTIGSEGGAAKSGSGAISIGSVISVGNVLNGLYAANTSNAALIRSDVRAVQVREGTAAKRDGSSARAIAMNLNVQNLVVGTVDALSGAIARPNGRNGICLLGISDAVFDRIRVGDATMNAFEITASQRINIRRMLAGMRAALPASGDDVGSIGGSILKIAESLDITVGSESASDEPVQGVAAGGWFMDVQDSERIDVRNVLAGLSANMESLSSSVRTAMRNLSGGISIHNTPFATIGMMGVPTILANNGGNASMPQAGLFATGELSEAFRALNLHIGTTPTGLTGIGNLGSGMVLADGIREASLGGENPFEKIVSAGNMGYGYLFRDIGPTVPTKGGEIIVSINATRLVSDMIPLVSGDVAGLSNALSGFCMLRAQGIRMNMFSVGPSGRHGIESIDSSDLEMLAGSIGSLFDKTIENPDDLMGPTENGVSISGGSRIGLGGSLGVSVLDIVNVAINDVGGRGVSADGVERLELSNLGVGVGLLGSPESQATLAKMGSPFEAIAIRNSLRAKLQGLHLFGNGAQSPSGVGGVLVESSGKVGLIRSLFGEVGDDGSPQRPNLGTAIKSILSDSMRVTLNRIVGHQTGVESDNSSMTLNDNVVEMQGLLGGVGDAVKQLGGTMEALRNTLSGNTGAAFSIQEAGSSIIRFNNIAGNAIGVAAAAVEDANVPAGAVKSSAAARVFAPDNWWGDSSGPGGVGPGAGDSITEGVVVGNWLTSASGIVISPERSAVEAATGESVVVPVRFATPLLPEDVIDVTVSDERGWVTSAASLSVPVSGSAGGTRDVEVTVGDSGASRITVAASSTEDPILQGEAVIVIASPGSMLPLKAPAVSGDDVLDIDAGDTFVVGGEILINPGGATQETAVIAGFGSILLESPLRFDHAAGEVVAPANRMAVDSEEPAEAALPVAWGMKTYPNPARQTLRLTLDAPSAGKASVEVFDLLGRRIATISKGGLSAGQHEFELDVTGLTPGVYVARATSGVQMMTTLVTVVR